MERSSADLTQDDDKGQDVTGHTIMADPDPDPDARILASLAEQVASGALRVAAAFGTGTPGEIAISCS
ncbi:hypothetical protein [Streptomyces sp. NBC_00310]|uniref:hypothetical protein n=1 Tax=Streptomyces sp. NBC_00310 TaxID=2903645 RepID=UPI002E2052F7